MPIEGKLWNLIISELLERSFPSSTSWELTIEGVEWCMIEMNILLHPYSHAGAIQPTWLILIKVDLKLKKPPPACFLSLFLKCIL